MTTEEIEKASKAFAEGATFDPTMKPLIAEIFDKGVRWALSQPQKNGFIKLTDTEISVYAEVEKNYSGDRICLKHIKSAMIDIAKWVRDHYESQSVSQPQWIDVKFKTLEEFGWRVINVMGYESFRNESVRTPFGDYDIEELLTGGWIIRDSFDMKNEIGGTFHDFEDAKKAAQADFYAKCKSLLKP